MSEASRENRDGLRSPLVWATLLAVGLAIWLYGGLIVADSAQGQIDSQAEQFFFRVNEAAGVPVLLLTLWLFYRRSHYRDLLMGEADWLAAGGAYALTLSLFGWGLFTKSEDLQLMSLIPLLAGCVLALGGRAGLRAFWVPILFFGFALPISPVLISAVMYPVQLATAQYAGLILNAIGVQSFVQGDQILRPQNIFVVIESCSGLRTVVTLTMLTVLLIDLFERRGRHAVILLVLAPIVAFLTNGIRVVTLVLNPHSAIHSIHNLQGIAMLLVGLTGMYFIDGVIERVSRRAGSNSEEADYGTATAVVASSGSRSLQIWSPAVVLGLLVTMSLSIPAWSVQRQMTEAPGELLDRIFAEWPSEELQDDYQFRGSVRYLAWARRMLKVDGRDVEVFLALGDETQRDYTVLSPRLPWRASGYARVEEEEVTRGPASGGGSARRSMLKHGSNSMLSYSWYQNAGSYPSEYLRHALALDRSPFQRRAHIVAVRVSAEVGVGISSLESAEDRIAQVRAVLEPELVHFGDMPAAKAR